MVRLMLVPGLLVGLLILGVGDKASAQSSLQLQGQLKEKPVEKDAPLWKRVYEHMKFSTVSLSSFVGSGTFVANSYSDDPYFAQSLSFGPVWAIKPGINASLGWSLNCEYTDVDNPNGRRCNPSDISLGISHLNLWRDPLINGRVTAGFGLILPISYNSRFNHTITNLSARVGYLKDFFKGKLLLVYGFSVTKFLPYQRYRGFGPNAEAENDSNGIPVVLTRQTPESSFAAGTGGPMNDNWAFGNNFTVIYNILERLTLTVAFGISNNIRFAVPDDFSGTGLPNTGRADLTRGNIDLTYAPFDHFWFSVGTFSAQPALTADNKSIRFPFWDFVSPRNNFSSIYFSVTAAL